VTIKYFFPDYLPVMSISIVTSKLWVFVRSSMLSVSRRGGNFSSLHCPVQCYHVT